MDDATRPDAGPAGPPPPAAGHAFPEHLVEQVWSYFERDRRGDRAEWIHPGSVDQVRTLVMTAYQAGLRSEEIRPVRCQVSFAPGAAVPTVGFARPVPYRVAALCRLSPAIGIGPRWLVVAPEAPGAASLRIEGIADPVLTPDATRASVRTPWAEGMGLQIPEAPGLGLSMLGPGWLRIATGAQKFFELRDCTLRSPYTIHEIPPVRRWYAAVAAALGAPAGGVGVALVRRTWAGIVSRVRDERHGGTLLVVPAGATGALPVRIEYASEAGRLAGALRARMALEPALSSHVAGRDDVPAERLEQAHFLERDVDRASALVAAAAGADGAVLLAEDLTLLGFGAELVNVVPPGEDEAVPHGRMARAGAGGARRLASFGMRHRSAYRFCQQVPGAIAFVVSQDGDVRVFAGEAGKIELYDGATPENLVMAG